MAVLSQGHSFVWGRALKNTMGSTGWHLALPAMLPKEKGRQFCTCGFFPFLFQSWQFSLSSRVPYYAPEIAICFYFSARNQLWRCSCRKVNEEFQPKNENKGVKRVVIISNIFTFFLNFFYIYLSISAAFSVDCAISVINFNHCRKDKLKILQQNAQLE